MEDEKKKLSEQGTLTSDAVKAGPKLVDTPDAPPASSDAAPTDAKGPETSKQRRAPRTFSGRGSRAFPKEVGRRLQGLNLNHPVATAFLASLEKADQLTRQIDFLRLTAQSLSEQISTHAAELPARVGRLRAFEAVEPCDLSEAMRDEGFSIRQMYLRVSPRTLSAIAAFARLLELRAARAETRAHAHQTAVSTLELLALTDQLRSARWNLTKLTSKVAGFWRETNAHLTVLKKWLKTDPQYQGVYGVLFERGGDVTDLRPEALKPEGTAT